MMRPFVRARAGRHAPAVALLCAGLVASLAAPALAMNAGESRLVSLTNAARSERGLRALVVAYDLAARAHQHSADMAARGRAFHSSSLPGTSGENVAKVRSVDEAHRLFMRSSTHRANILYAAYTVIGTGVVKRGDWLYVTEIFSLRRVTRYPGVARASRAAVRPIAVRPPVRIAPAPPRTMSMLMRILALDGDSG